MEANENMNTEPMEASESMSEPQSSEPQEPTPQTSKPTPEQRATMDMGQAETRKAGFGIRFLAFLIDAFTVGAVAGILGSIFGSVAIDNLNANYGLFPSLLMTAYLVVMDVEFGATLGKMVFKLKVVDSESGDNLSYVDAILREFLGKAVSGFLLGIGYLWVIWDSEKQGLHDKIGGSYVVKELK